MIQLLFVCHGNICRSPMAQYIFAQRAAARGIACVTDSAATSREEIGNPIYPPAKRKLKEMGVPFGDHRAVQMPAPTTTDTTCSWPPTAPTCGT